MDEKKLMNILDTLQKNDIPNFLYSFIDNTGSKKSINDIIKKITGENSFCIEIQNDIKSSPELGLGAVNIVKYLGKDYIIRYTKNDFDLNKLVFFETETTVEDENTGTISTKKKYILSDSLYDIVIQSIISQKLGNSANFNMYFGSFYCNNNKKMYSISEKNDMSLRKLFLDIATGTQNNIINSQFLFNILFQYSWICGALYANGIVDFDRHLDNIMLKNIGSFSGAKSRYNKTNQNMYAVGKDKYILKNIEKYVVPIDFGISIYTSPKFDIYNEAKQYNVTLKNCSSTFTQLDNIKAKYAVINTDIHPNVMFFFFLKNLLKYLNYVKTSSNILNKAEIEDFVNTIKKTFVIPNCGNILVDYEFRDDNQNPEFYLYRNIGIPNMSMVYVIETLYNTMKSHANIDIQNMIEKQ